MSLLGNLKSEGLEAQEERVGGFSLLDTALYAGKVKTAYITKSSGGAMAVNLILDINGREYRERPIWITNKNGENSYDAKDRDGKKTGKKAQLPGFQIINTLCRVSIDRELSELDTEEKIVNIFDFDERKDIPKSVPVIVDLIGGEALFAIERQKLNKQQKNDQTDQYEDIADEREQNEIVAVMHLETRKTISEIEGNREATFGPEWEKKWGGTVRDKRTIKDGAGAARNGRPAGPAGGQSAGGERKTNSLFNRDQN